MTVSFFVPGLPKASPRPRRGKAGHFYVPPSADAWKEAIGWNAKSQIRGRRCEGPVTLALQFHMRCPVRGISPAGTPHTAKPDIDNLQKACLDALNGIAWRDDAQVWEIHVTKKYAATPGVTVTIQGLS